MQKRAVRDRLQNAKCADTNTKAMEYAIADVNDSL